MPTKEVMLTFNTEFIELLTKKARSQGFSNVQKYIYDLLHHAVYNKKHTGGRPRHETFDDKLAGAVIAKQTKESRKRLAWAKRWFP